MAMVRKSFNDLNKKAEEQKAAEEARKNGNGYHYEAPTFVTCILAPGTSKVLRWWGPTMLEDPSSEYFPVKVDTSWFRDKDGKPFTFIWSQDSNHPMYELKKAVLGKYKWIEETKTKVYDNAALQCHQIWMHPSTNPKMKGTADPTTMYFVNIIDRSDSWCKDNKHTKLLCWDTSTYVDKNGDEKQNITYGVRSSFWKGLWNKVCDPLAVHPWDTDFYVRHLAKDEVVDQFEQLSFMDSDSKAKLTKAGEKYGEDFLSEFVEEDDINNYEGYDFKDIPYMTSPTPCSYLLTKMGWYFTLVDSELGTNFTQKFTEYAAKEKAEWEAKHPKTEGDKTEAPKVETPKPVVEEKIVVDTPSFNTMEPVKSTETEVVEEELPNFQAPRTPIPSRTPVAPAKELRKDFNGSNEAKELFELIQTDDWSPENKDDATAVADAIALYPGFDPEVIKEWLVTNFGIQG